MFAVTGISRAITVVTDIQTGYFARLVITPVNRLGPLLLGLMVADFVLIVALTVPVVIMGYVVGVRFETGLPGILAFMLIAGFWGLVFQRLPLRHRPQDGQRSGGQYVLYAVLSLPVYDHPVHSRRNR